MAQALPLQVRLRNRIDEVTQRLALRAGLTAAHLLGLATGAHLRELRNQDDPLVQAQARAENSEMCARLAFEALEMLAARFSKIPEGHRPYYTPAQRFRILEIKNFFGWGAKETGRVFLQCPNTIHNWEKAADPQTKTAGSTVKPHPPVRRAADVVQSIVQLMSRLGFGGQDMIARVLARASWTVSSRSVGRYLRARPILAPTPPAPPLTRRPTRPVVARFVHHTWMMDVSVVKQLLGPDLFMAAAFDAFSRVPLALQVFDQRPSALDMVHLLRRAVRGFASPKYLITDLGGEFIAKPFHNAVRRLGSVHRFASKENLYATARLERFWRTLKQSAHLYRFGLPLTVADLEQRLAFSLLHYVCFRPHEGLRGATPAEAFLGSEPACRSAAEPPRGRPGQRVGDPPFQIANLDPEHRFPVLTAAA